MSNAPQNQEKRRFKIYKAFHEQNDYPVGNVRGSFEKGIVFDADENKYKFLKLGSPIIDGDLGTQYGEYYCSQILKALGFKKNIVNEQESTKSKLTYVEYDMLKIRDKMYCLADLYTSKNKIFRTLESYLKEPLKREGISFDLYFELRDVIEKHFGKENFEDLMVFDVLVLNTDRHLRNLEIEIDAETNKEKGPSPIFDNGLSFFGYLRVEDLDNIEEALQDQTSAFQMSFDAQLEYFVQPRHIEMYDRLKNFKFERGHDCDLDEEALNKIEQFIQKRAKHIVSVARKKFGIAEPNAAQEFLTDAMNEMLETLEKQTQLTNEFRRELK